jgi:superoxide dismutase, Cu-Zn family
MKTLPIRLRKLALALPIAGICVVGCWDDDDDNGIGPGAQFPETEAAASVRGYEDTTIRGTVTFQERGDSVLVQAAIGGLAPLKAYAMHVHQFGNCSEPDSSGDHFASPGEPHGNPFDSLPLHHRGDLPNILTDGAGIGRVTFTTGDFTLDSAETSILGRSVVVHINQDDYVTQPAGNSDARIACGVIGLITGGGNIDTTGNPADTTGNPTDTTGNPADTTNNPVDTTGLPGRPY